MFYIQLLLLPAYISQEHEGNFLYSFYFTFAQRVISCTAFILHSLRMNVAFQGSHVECDESSLTKFVFVDLLSIVQSKY